MLESENEEDFYSPAQQGRVTLKKPADDAGGAMPEGGNELINASLVWVQDKTDFEQNQVFKQVRCEVRALKQLVNDAADWLDLIETELAAHEGRESDPKGIIVAAVEALFESEAFELTGTKQSDFTFIKSKFAGLLGEKKAMDLSEVVSTFSPEVQAKVGGRTIKTTWTLKEWFFLYVTVLSELTKISKLPPSPTKSMAGGGGSSTSKAKSNVVGQLGLGFEGMGTPQRHEKEIDPNPKRPAEEDDILSPRERRMQGHIDRLMQQVEVLRLDAEHQKAIAAASVAQLEKMTKASEGELDKGASKSKSKNKGTRGKLKKGKLGAESDSEGDTSGKESDVGGGGSNGEGSSISSNRESLTSSRKKERKEMKPSARLTVSYTADNHRAWLGDATVSDTEPRTLASLKRDGDTKLVRNECGGFRVCMTSGRLIRGWYGSRKVGSTYQRPGWHFYLVNEDEGEAETPLSDEPSYYKQITTPFPMSYRQYPSFKAEQLRQLDRREDEGFEAATKEDRENLNKFFKMFEIKIKTCLPDMVEGSTLDSRKHITGWAVAARFFWHAWNGPLSRHDFTELASTRRINDAWESLRSSVVVTNDKHEQCLKEASLFLRYSCAESKCRIGVGMYREICNSCDLGLALLGGGDSASAALKREKNQKFSVWKKAQAQGTPRDITTFLAIPGNEKYKSTGTAKVAAWTDEEVYKALATRQNLVRSHGETA